MRILTVNEAAKAIHRSTDVIDAAIKADPEHPNHLQAYIDPASKRGRVIFEDDLEAWVRRNYEPVSAR